MSFAPKSTPLAIAAALLSLLVSAEVVGPRVLYAAESAGTLQGTVTYSGPAAGTDYIAVWSASNGIPDLAAAAPLQIVSGSFYSFSLASGDYVVAGYRDVDGNGSTNRWDIDAGEPGGVYTDPAAGQPGEPAVISVTAEAIEIRDFTIYDFSIQGDDTIETQETAEFSARGNTGGVTWRLEADTTAAVATFSGAGAKATPAQAGSFTLWATDGATGAAVQHRVDVFEAVSVTHKPAEDLVVPAGSVSATLTATGGDQEYIWTVTGPAGDPIQPLERTGAAYAFRAPKTGPFAGKYTIKVTDGNGFSDRFTAYVPIRLMVVDDEPASTSEAPISPVLKKGANYTLWASGVAADADLDIAYKEEPLTAGERVLGNGTGEGPPNSTSAARFDISAKETGAAVITVVAADDPEGASYQGFLRVDVVSRATLVGTIVDIPGNLIADPPADITVELLDPTTRKTLAPVSAGGPGEKATRVNAAGSFIFEGLPWGAYYLRVTAQDADDDPRYIKSVTGRRITVQNEQVYLTCGISPLASIEQAFYLTVALGGDYTAGDAVDYRIFDEASGEIVCSGTSAASPIVEPLKRGLTYRVVVSGKKYFPHAVEHLGATDIRLDQHTTIEAHLSSRPPAAVAAHRIVEGGFELSVVTQNFSGDLALAIDGVGTVVPSEGSGDEDDPYTYRWTPAVGPAGTVNEDGDVSYAVVFTFTDRGGPAVLNRRYQVDYIEYRSAENESRDKSGAQQEIEDEAEKIGGTLLSKSLAAQEFYPLEGASFQLMLTDSTGAPRSVDIAIPPLPLKYLYVDDFDRIGAGADNLRYDAASDRYTFHGDKRIEEDTVLTVEVEYYILAGGAVGSGLWMSLKVADPGPTAAADPGNGLAAGDAVKYNPEQVGTGFSRDPNAPILSLPLLLNTQRPEFQDLPRLSEARPRIAVMVSERGDGTDGFREASLPLLVQDDGLLLLDVHHLSSFSLGNPSVSGGTTGGGGGGGGCFIATAAYGSVLDPHGEILPNFRDVYLIPNAVGKALVAAYYRYSPPIAEAIADPESLKVIVRAGLLPLVGFGYGMLSTSAAAKCLIAAAALLAAGAFFGCRCKRPRRQ